MMNMTKKKCPICKQVMESIEETDVIGVCATCGIRISFALNLILDKYEGIIMIKYNIHHLEEPPIVDCVCGSNSSITFDYFTIPNKNKYEIVLNSICSKCCGYKEIPTKELINIQVKDNLYKRYSDKTDEQIQEKKSDMFV